MLSARSIGRLSLLVAVLVCLDGRPVGGRSSKVLVGPGGNLQGVLDAAQPGDVILLQAGATFVGNFVLPRRKGNDDRYITVRSSIPDSEVPNGSTRVTAEHAALMPALRSPNGGPALRTAPGARHWRLLLLEFRSNAGGAGDIIQLGDGSSAQSSAAAVPEDLVIDRCYIHGDPEVGQKRGIALNSGTARIVNSLVTDIKIQGQDSQAIAGWNGPGPYTILNNRLEAAGQGILFGGADPAIRGLVPTDIWIRGNHLTRPAAWRGSKWQVKNLLELKSARDVRVEGNLFEHNWSAAQSGYAVLLTPRNQDGGAPWSTVENVSFRYNVIRHVAAALNLLGRDSPNPSGTMRAVAIADNLLYDVDGKSWGGNGEFLRIGDGPSQLTVEHNTVMHSGNLISVYGGSRERPTPVDGFTFRFNLARHPEYGVHGSDRGVGNDTLSSYFPAVVFAKNVIGGGAASAYPPENTFTPASGFDRLFVDAGNGDYRVAANSQARDDEDGGPGADIEQVTRAWRGAQVGEWVDLPKLKRERDRLPPRRGKGDWE